MWKAKDQLYRIEERLQRLETLYIVRDPGNAVSADAYEGLRKRIASAAKNREQHLVNLAQLDQVVQGRSDISLVAAKVEEFMATLGLVRVTHLRDLPNGLRIEEAFEVDGSGTEVHVDAPAYVERPAEDDPEGRGRVHIRGRATRTQASDAPEELPHQSDHLQDGNGQLREELREPKEGKTV